MKDFVSRQWSRAVTLVTSMFDGGTSTRTIWQVIGDVEAEAVPVPVLVPVPRPASVPSRPPTWIR